jgi:hypothetical protein
LPANHSGAFQLCKAVSEWTQCAKRAAELHRSPTLTLSNFRPVRLPQFCPKFRATKEK